MTLTAPPIQPSGRSGADRPLTDVGPDQARPPAPRRTEVGSPDNSVYVVPTLLGAAAVLAGSSALSAAIKGSSWVLPLIEVVAVVWLVGIGGRLIKVPAAVTVLLQVLGLAIALTALFTTGGYGGVIPNFEVFREFGALFSGAWHQILVSAPPAPSSPELSFLIALALGLAAIIVDFLIAEAHAPALVALPLLCLYSVPASIAETLLPWWTFVAPAVLYAVLLAVSGHPGRQRGARVGVGMAASGLGIIVVTTLVAVLVADAFTAVGTAGRLPRTGTGSGEVGLSPFASLHGNLQRSAPVDLLTVQGLDEPDYLRTAALTVWTPGEGWSPSDMQADVPNVHGLLPGMPEHDDAKRVTIDSIALKDKFLPIFSDSSSVSGIADGWNFDQSLGTVWRTDAVNPGGYSLVTSFAKVDAKDLRKDTVTPGGALTETGTLPRRVVQLAQDITEGEGNAFDKADALLEYFTDPANGFRYSLNVPVGNTGDALTDFLENKQGYCEQYASAMAIMLRSVGIPARVAVGFTQGTEKGNGSYTISSHDAHAWVEVLFDDNGWVRFDPTPLAGNTGGVQGFDQAAAPTTGTDSTATSDSTESVAGTVLSGAGNQLDDETATSPAAGDLGAGDSSGAGSGVSPTLLWILGILVVLALCVLTPSVVRSARRKRRLAMAGGGGPGSAAAAWAEIEDLCLDHGIGLRPSESARATANRLAKSAYLNDAARSKLRALVVAVEREWYAEHGDGSPGATVTTKARTTDLAAAVQAVTEGLNQSTPLTLGDKVLPRSIRPSARD
jgi:transglutaminase-like putative cysteine protease